jgi:hypothetical protein
MNGYENLTYEEILAKSKEYYPQMFFGSEVDSLARVEVKLESLAKCDDLTPTEKWKVEVLLPNIKECLT